MYDRFTYNWLHKSFDFVIIRVTIEQIYARCWNSITIRKSIALVNGWYKKDVSLYIPDHVL